MRALLRARLIVNQAQRACCCKSQSRKSPRGDATTRHRLTEFFPHGGLRRQGIIRVADINDFFLRRVNIIYPSIIRALYRCLIFRYAKYKNNYSTSSGSLFFSSKLRIYSTIPNNQQARARTFNISKMRRIDEETVSHARGMPRMPKRALAHLKRDVAQNELVYKSLFNFLSSFSTREYARSTANPFVFWTRARPCQAQTGERCRYIRDRRFYLPPYVDVSSTLFRPRGFYRGEGFTSGVPFRED